MPYPYTPPAHHKFITVRFDDIGAVSSVWVVPGFRGKVKKIHSVIHGALTTAAAILTPKIGGVAVTNGALTITQSGSAAGDIDTSKPTAANSFSDTQAIEIASDGGPANTPVATITLELEPV